MRRRRRRRRARARLHRRSSSTSCAATVAPIRRIAAATRAGRRRATRREGAGGRPGRGRRARPLVQRDGASRSSGSRRDLATQNVDLERLANVLRAVLDSTVDGILLSDADGNVQLANRPVLSLTRELGMSYEGPVVDRLLSVEHRIKDREQVPRGDGAPAHESRRGRRSTSSRTRSAAASSRASRRPCATIAAGSSAASGRCAR